MTGKKHTLDTIHRRIRQCPLCRLSRTRTNAVPGTGSVQAAVMFIGEAPGKNEDEQGRPFVGRAGKILDEMLGAVELEREGVFITNLVKCRPPSNRDPRQDEIQTCAPYLQKQLDIIEPLVLVTLGRLALKRWFPMEPISQVHGRILSHEGRPVLPMYHPAAALYQRKLRPVMEEDFTTLSGFLRKHRD